MFSFAWLALISPIQTKQIFYVFLSAFLFQNRETSEKLTHYFNKKIIPRLEKEHSIYCAFNDNEIIGFVIFEPWEEKNYYLAEMAILPDYQGQGIGRQLVFSIFDKDPKAKKILLVTEEANKWSQAFYEKIEFQRSSFQHPDYPNGFIGYEFNR